MSVDAFWALVDRARSEVADPADVSEIAARVVDVLAEQDPGFMAVVDVAMRGEMALVRVRPLWGAAHLILGGCSEDEFEAFLGWLAAQGRATFQAAFADPDSLADLGDDVLANSRNGAPMLVVPAEAHRRKTGEELLSGGPVQQADLGEDWDFADPAEMSARYPRLWERFGG